MHVEQLLARARQAAGLSQDELATRAHTSRTTLSAYEHGRKSPTLQTAARVLAAAGFTITAEPRVLFTDKVMSRGRVAQIPSSLPRLSIEQAFATVELPLHLNWSQPGRRFDLRDRHDRARVYEVVLREGTADDILRYVDGALLIDLWNELVIPRDIRSAWSEVVIKASPEAA